MWFIMSDSVDNLIITESIKMYIYCILNPCTYMFTGNTLANNTSILVDENLRFLTSLVDSSLGEVDQSVVCVDQVLPCVLKGLS